MDELERLIESFDSQVDNDSLSSYENKAYVSSSFRMYLHDISKYPILTAEEEKELALRVKQNDQVARLKLIECNLKLVVNVVLKKRYPNLELIDAINEGNIALMKATEHFDPEMGYRFTTFAATVIKQHLIRASYSNAPISISEGKLREAQQFIKNIAKLEEDTKRKYSITELAEIFKMRYEEVIDFMCCTGTPISLNTKIADEDDVELFSFIANENCTNPEEYAIEQYHIQEIYDVLNSLSEKERNTLKLRFGLDGNETHTLKETGAILNCTGESIRQTENQVIKKLRAPHYARKLI